MDIRPGSLASNLDSIRKGVGSGEGPARATVPRDMLVLDGSQIVDSVNVAPVKELGQLLHRQLLEGRASFYRIVRSFNFCSLSVSNEHIVFFYLKVLIK